MCFLQPLFFEGKISMQQVETFSYNNCKDIDFELSYVIFQVHLAKELIVNKSAVSSKILKNFLTELEKKHFNKLITRSKLVKEMFLLNQLVLCFEEYNKDVLQMSTFKFRANILYPNTLYILMRYFETLRNFIQKTIRTVYGEYRRKAIHVVRKYEKSFFYNNDIIHYDVKLRFLGNGIKVFNPLYVDNFLNFYKQVFRNILFYYFMKKHNVHTELVSHFILTDLEQQHNIHNITTELSLYREVLYELQINKIYEYSPSFFQMKYNFNIFKNIIYNNEFQTLYLTRTKNLTYLNNNQYKLTQVYDYDIKGKLKEIKKLPTIYRLLKAVHIFSNKNSNIENKIYFNPVKTAVIEELMYPFRNLFNQDVVHEIIEQIAVNFTKSILSGEYINLITLSPIKINQVSFISQIKKFIKICLQVD